MWCVYVVRLVRFPLIEVKMQEYPHPHNGGLQQRKCKCPPPPSPYTHLGLESYSQASYKHKVQSHRLKHTRPLHLHGDLTPPKLWAQHTVVHLQGGRCIQKVAQVPSLPTTEHISQLPNPFSNPGAALRSTPLQRTRLFLRKWFYFFITKDARIKIPIKC